MKKPEVTLRNHEAVYDYYGQYRQPKFGAYIGHKIMSLMFRPNVEYAEGAKQKIDDILARPNGRLVVALNHLSDNDQYVVSAMAMREPFKAMVGKTFIQAKEPLFHHPNRAIRPVLRGGVDVMGAIPAFRKKDVLREEDVDLRKQATDRMLRTSIYKMNNGQHMAIFPEGTRNHEQPDVVQELKPGICAVLGGVASNLLVGVVPIGFTYEGDKRHPRMWVEEPMSFRDYDDQGFLTELRTRLQYSVDRAYENTNT